MGLPSAGELGTRIRWVLPRSLLPALVGISLTGHPLAGQGGGEDYVGVEVATVGVDLRSGAPLALLHSEWEEVLAIWIGDVEARAIADHLQGSEPPRPMTHDLLTSVLGALDGTLEEVRVHDLRENTYYGLLRIRVGDELREVDSRPSDALALAVRTGASIRVARHLIRDHPDVEFVSVDRDRPIVRLRGITAATPSDRDRARFGLPAGREGVVVLQSDHGVGPRGVVRGDLILEVEGAATTEAMEFMEALGSRSDSAPVSMRILRNGEEQEVEVAAPRGPGRVGP